jgi:hypothetical protein
MKPHQKTILALCLFLIVLSGCSNSVSKEMEDKFHVAVPITDMNQSLQLKVDSDEKTFRPGSEIPIRINNRSPYSIFLC